MIDLSLPPSKGDDPLVPWLSYIKFVQETYPADTQQSFLLMERCTRAFIGKKRYMNDVRFIRVCILYADRTSSPTEVYKVCFYEAFLS
jgi:hypothetical protein